MMNRIAGSLMMGVGVWLAMANRPVLVFVGLSNADKFVLEIEHDIDQQGVEVRSPAFADNRKRFVIGHRGFVNPFTHQRIKHVSHRHQAGAEGNIFPG